MWPHRYSLAEVYVLGTGNGKFAINVPFYQWSVRAFGVVHKRLGMTINVHADEGVLDDGQIFLFNHFARFETIIPQYFIYQATGAYSRCVATPELFEGSERFSRVLWGAGAVPSNHPGLLAFLAAEILRGQKVIIFPEGSMMKDRSVAAPPAESFLASFKERTGHRQGAAALALVLEVFKKRILQVEEAGETERLDRWVAALGLADRAGLLAAARKPTLVVPSNITFHPIHRGENFLLKAADFFKFELGKRGREELMVEGNLLLRQTDMDIRFGRPVNPDTAWNMADRMFVTRAFEQVDSLDELFGLRDKADHWIDKMVGFSMQRAARRLRDHCMVEMYARVTLNINHLAARLLMHLAAQGEKEIESIAFYARLYAIIKAVQKEPGLHLHRTLTTPNLYHPLPGAVCPALQQFIDTASEAGLIEVSETHLKLLPTLIAGTTDGDPRLANVIRVYANEIQSLTQVLSIVENSAAMSGAALAQSLFDDEGRAHQIDRISETFTIPNEPGKQDGAAFLLQPNNVTKSGVVLVHGFLASPAEVRAFGERLMLQGHPVIGVRLKGHGTSPQDLCLRSQHDWMASVRRGYDIMSNLSNDVLVVGFATGASLALLLAAERPKQLAFVASVSAPITFGAQSVRFAPLFHRINSFSQLVYRKNGVRPFTQAEPDHPDIDYRNMPVQALAELRKVAGDLEAKLADIICPVMIIHASQDPVAKPESAHIIAARIGSMEKTLHIIESDRHGILHENIGGVQELIVERLGRFALPDPKIKPVQTMKQPSLGSKIASLLSRLSRKEITFNQD